LGGRARDRRPPRAPSGPVGGGLARRLLRDLPRARPRHRAAAGRQRAPLQHGFRDRDRHPPRARRDDRPRASRAGRQTGPARGGSRRRARWGGVRVPGDRRRRRVMRRPAPLAAAILLALAPPAHAHLMSTGFGPFYDGLTHLFVTPEDLLLVIGVGL